ncbi:uncharacterized protein B0T15DRAFT_397975 [Chaetomium strumarium]|uniref:Uncharacterized protein n=1 Tax=Chaetomium strumarium TaxID=1170767 RepID=A0AAJ0GTX5_9PEZI|nr:hypothetical protein B0T15DRAFT_397975 [Chaetomium strumarium]
MSIPSGGHNPAFGHNGPPPPGTTRTVQPLVYYAIPRVGVFPRTPPMACYYPGYGPPPPYAAAPYAAPYAALYPAAAPALGATYAIDGRGQVYQYISGFNGSGRYPQPAPPVDPTFPAANLINSTGGAGAEPGYNYFFPTRHAKVAVLKCPSPPWKVPPGTVPGVDDQMHKTHIPANVTIAEILAGFGCQNPDKAKNQLWEVYEQGGGRWGWREHITGDDEVMTARTVLDMGWCEVRNGDLPVTYLWLSKT